jgi:uncharacterized membrane protein
MAMIIFAPLWGVLGLLTSIMSMRLIGRSDLLGNAVQKSIVATVCTLLIFPLIVTLAFPTDWPGRIIQEFPRTRLVCYGVGALGMAFALFFALKGRKAATEQVQSETNVA